jgi:hypothetical protein
MRIPITIVTAAFTTLISIPLASSANAQVVPESSRPAATHAKVIEVGAVAVADTVRPTVQRPAVIAPRAHTGWPALDQAIEKIPHYYEGVATWHVGDRGGWGLTYLNTGDIYIAPRTPADRLVDVVLHEYAHALTVRLYGGANGLIAAADRHFQQPGVPSYEIEADCMALVEGATWTWYTSCQNSHWRADAQRLLRYHKLS